MEALEAAFAEVDGGNGGGGAPAMKQAPKETIMTNIDPHAGKKAAAKKKAPHQISKYDEEEEDSEQAMRGNNDGPNSKMQRSPVKGQQNVNK